MLGTSEITLCIRPPSRTKIAISILRRQFVLVMAALGPGYVKTLGSSFCKPLLNVSFSFSILAALHIEAASSLKTDILKIGRAETFDTAWVMNGPKATSALNPFYPQLPTLVGGAAKSPFHQSKLASPNSGYSNGPTEYGLVNPAIMDHLSHPDCSKAAT